MKPAIQGGGLNYLGKQKMVTAPKKWLSSPDHEPAELAYITEKEKDILIDLDLYGSLNGKPNRGPAGIMSLQGDMGSIGGGRSSSGGGGGGGGGGRPHYDPPPPPRVSPMQSIAMTGNTSLAGKTQSQAQASVDRGNAMKAAEGKVDVGFQEALKKTADARQREKEFEETGDYDVFADTTLQPGPRIDTKDIMGEVTDPGSVSYDPNYKTPEEIRTLSQDPNFGQFFRPPPVVEKPKSGIGTILKNIALGVLAPQLLAGTSLAKPYSLYRTYETAKRYLPKGVQETIQTAFTPKLTTEKEYTKNLVKGPSQDKDGQRVKTAAEQVATGEGLESGAKLLGINDTQKAELFKRKGVVENILRKGSYQGRDLTSEQKNNLMNYIEQINKFLVPVQQGI